MIATQTEREWVAFLAGHWTQAPPTKPGTYEIGQRDWQGTFRRIGRATAYEDLNGPHPRQIYWSTGQAPPYGSWRWSEVMPELPRRWEDPPSPISPAGGVEP
jgi:hypothetical protein